MLKRKKRRLKVNIPKLCIVLSAVLLLLLVSSLIFLKTYHKYTETVVAPTCTEDGYTQNVCSICHELNRKSFTPALGHDYGEWEITQQKSEISFGIESKTCRRCDDVQTQYLEPTTSLAKLYIDGNVVFASYDRDAGCHISYKDKDGGFECFGQISMQDENTRNDPKLDYKLQLYKDSGYRQEKEVSLGGWRKSSEFNLNGDYYDYSKARNLGSSQLYSQIIGSRGELNNTLAESPNRGANTGYPILVYINYEFRGIYHITPPKNEMLFSSKDKEPAAVVYSNVFNSVTQFKAEANPSGYEWEVIYADNNKQAVYDSFNRLIRCVRDNDGEELTEKLDTYLDVDAAIDYMLTMYTAGAGANTARNMFFVTYDGVRWIPSMYDLDMTFGLDSIGNTSLLTTTLVPEHTGDGIKTDTSSLLWQRLLDNYFSQAQSRYRQLRSSELTEDNIMAIMKAQMDEIPKQAYSLELETYPSTPSSRVEPLTQISIYLENRFLMLDKFFS